MSYKTTLTSEVCSYLERAIEYILNGTDITADDIAETISVAALMEVITVLRKKQVEYKREYKVKFTSVQALSLCYLYSRLCDCVGFHDYLLNRLHQINNEVVKKYTV